MAADDRILIRDLRVEASIGVSAEERAHPQPLLLQLSLFHDLRAAGESDDLSDTLDYARVAAAVKAYVEGSRHHLVEALAAGVARLVLGQPGASRVRLRVEKLRAVEGVGAVGVEIERRRGEIP